MFCLLQKRRGLLGLGLLAVMAAAPAADAADLHVPGDFPTITIAINNASDGDTIIIAPGNYFQPIDLGNKQISLIGSGGPEVTTINVFGKDSCLRITGGQTLDTVIEGLTFTGGLAYRGGGIFIDGASATVRNCRFIGNHATLTAPGGSDPGDGGGLFIENGSLVLENCEFLDNVSADVGGGAYLRTGTNVTVTDCHFEGNIAERGAGMAAFQATASIFDSTFLMNGTIADTQDGGGLHVHGSGSNVLVDRCRFEGNTIWDDGFAVRARGGSHVELRNSLFLNNIGAEGPTPNGTIHSWEAGTRIDVFHCTLVGNSGPSNAGLRTFEGGEIVFHNGIIWDNDGTSFVGPSPEGSITVTYSVIQGGWLGTGNIDVDPMLDAELRHLPGSPVIDAGDTNVLLGEDPRDFDGNPRAVNDPDTEITGIPVYGMTADMGAFEFQPEGSGEPCPEPTCPADLTGDGVVDVSDLLQLLSNWGACPSS